MWNDKDIFAWLETIAIIAVLVFVCALFFNGCTTEQPATPPPVVKQACESGKWCQDYDDVIKNNTPPEFRDVNWNLFCAAPPVDRPETFRRIIQAISYAESNWKPEETYQEAFTDSTTGKPAVSIGMMQLSVSDRKYYAQYPSCKNSTDLYDAKQNLACGSAIAGHLILNKLPRSINNLGLYWAVARSNNKRFHVTTNKLKDLGGCK